MTFSNRQTELCQCTGITNPALGQEDGLWHNFRVFGALCDYQIQQCKFLVNTCFHYPPPCSPRLFHLTDLLIFFYPWPFLFLLKTLCPNCLIAILFLPDKDLPSLTRSRSQLQFKTLQLLTETPPLAASRANPWWTSCRALERLHLCVFSSHMDTHTELLLTLGERRSNHQLLAKQLLFLSPGYQRNPSLPFPSSTALLWLTDLALLPVNCKIGFR